MNESISIVSPVFLFFTTQYRFVFILENNWMQLKSGYFGQHDKFLL